MVKICPFSYPSDNESIYNIFYQQFKFPLHDFQKWAVESIVTGNHVLITAPTGTGKTVPAEFALNYFHSIGKKTIYTCPIKALSNEKFYDFTRKFPHVNIGLVTGDISCNPNADVIIMTLEILMNKLYNTSKINSFDLDIENELGCVVFDEIHFINDEKRGTNWEQTIMMLPQHIQIIGLSATLDHPENFAQWLENTLNKSSVENSVENSFKEVYLCRKLIRSVPLIHYSFISTVSAVNKIIKDKSLQQEIQQVVNKPVIIQNEKGLFNDINYQKINKILNLFYKNDIRINRRHILNKVSEYLVDNEMLPALCYVFSRKQLEICAEELTTNLLEFDSKVPYTVDYECEQILRKLPNYHEYLQLPEYIKTVELFRKGIGMHHAGLIPILREMTELLFAKGYIKMLFCTETMSIGINLPVKTTIFTDINKFNGDVLRTLYSHEYTQAAGRAGRLGLDSVGHVIHLTNLFRNTDSISIKEMMKGIPQKLFSKFNISYNLLLNLISSKKDIDEFMNLSMTTIEINNYIDEYENVLKEKQNQKEKKEKNIFYRTPKEIICEYIELKNKKNELVNKKRKEVERKIQNICENYNFIEQDVNIYLQQQHLEFEISDVENKIINSQNYLKNKKNIIFNKLLNDDYISSSELLENETVEKYILTLKGQVASNIREVHCLIFSNIIFFNSQLHILNTNEIIGFLSCFTNISVPDDKKCISPNSTSEGLNVFIQEIVQMYNQFSDFENLNNILSDNDNNINFELINYMIDWAKCETDMECKEVLQRLVIEKNIFSGEFVKAVLKINNIVEELKNVCEIIGSMDLYSKLNEIPSMTLKYIVTNQSLYV
jgi:superfamily II RNA helicase